VKVSKLSRTGAIVAIVVGDLLLLMTGWFLLIAPEHSKAASLVRATAATAAQLAVAQKPVRVTPAAAVQQPEIRTADVYSLARAMPTSLDMPTLLLELDQVARSAGVTLATISPGPPVSAASFSTVPIALTFTGDFYSVTDMLYRLRTLVTVRGGALATSGRLFSVDSVSLAPTGIGSQLNASVAVTAYIFGAPAPAVTVVPSAPATTGTDTTSTTTTTAPSADVAPAP
jgi:Tfp pilus assembly protein PilO